jgi:diguanylate cyclase (GGDEF)-like protein
VEERLAHDALHDALTGLPNRTLFVDRLEQRLEYSKRHKNDLFAILFIDLDRFKIINDSLGHTIGDKFLITTAQRLQSCLRPEDTVSRFGGDEFAVLLSEITDVSDAIRVADRIQARMKGTTLLGPVSRSSTASIGITIFNGYYTDPQEMLRDADSAMYRAKAQGGGRYQLFDVDMYKSALALLKLETDLKHAVEHQEWQIHYQPIISLPNGVISGVEALIRWKHPKRGLVSPAEFIGVAEESGLILQIGEYVLRESCRQIKIWREAGFPDLWVSVNISGRQFQDRNLLNIIEYILKRTGVSGDALRLEVTETVAMKDIEYSVKILKELDKLGIHLSLDDFGNGYSSLGYLKRFPLKVLKIDRSFIQDIEINKNSEAITSAIISMGHTLNLEVVAEGVETEEQLAFLKARFCNEVQGFLFSRPIPAEELSRLLEYKLPFLTPKH